MKYFATFDCILSDKAAMLKIPVQIKIGLLMTLAVLLITAAGYLSYRNLSSVVTSIQGGESPEKRMLSIREISMDLEKAQNSIRLYTVTNNQGDLKPYYRAISKIDSKVKELRTECLNDTLLVSQIDKIGRLIGDNIRIWNKLLSLNSSQNVVDYLNQLSDTLSTKAEEEAAGKKNIFRRIFGSNNKNNIKEKELLDNIRELRQQDSLKKDALSKREAQLAVTGTEIKVQFYDLINKTESEISDGIKEKAEAADKLASKTYLWLALFILFGTLLAIAVMFVIVRYVRKTRESQVALQNSKDESERLTKMKELFMANISHELRTPVTAISGFAEQLLLENVTGSIAQKIKIIKSSSDHLAGVINEILDFSKLQNGSMKLEQIHFRIKELPEEVCSMFEKQALNNNDTLGFSITPDMPDVLLGDPHRLKQIMINLISNSIKFTKNGRVHCALRTNPVNINSVELVLEVTDTGIGIDETRIIHIFEDFTQEESGTSRQYGGTGLGLSIVKKLVELQNGRIEAASKKNSGTRITCVIPFRLGDADKVPVEISSVLSVPDYVKNLNILVADDNEFNRLLFKTILDRWSVNHAEVSDGDEAIAILKKRHFDLLLIDSRMPGTDGLEATRIIRNELRIKSSEMPIICISAASMSGQLDKYIDAGINEFLPKPFTEENLLRIILKVKDEGIITYNKSRGNEVKADPAISSGTLNFQSLYHIAGDDKVFVKQMLESFLGSTANGLAELRTALLNEEKERVADIAHKLLPPCRHTGAMKLTELLMNIEKNANDSFNAMAVEKMAGEAITEFDIISLLIHEHIRGLE